MEKEKLKEPLPLPLIHTSLLVFLFKSINKMKNILFFCYPLSVGTLFLLAYFGKHTLYFFFLLCTHLISCPTIFLPYSGSGAQHRHTHTQLAVILKNYYVNFRKKVKLNFLFNFSSAEEK